MSVIDERLLTRLSTQGWMDTYPRLNHSVPPDTRQEPASGRQRTLEWTRARGHAGLRIAGVAARLGDSSFLPAIAAALVCYRCLSAFGPGRRSVAISLSVVTYLTCPRTWLARTPTIAGSSRSAVPPLGTSNRRHSVFGGPGF